jgi:hypothetical protein
MQPDITRSQVQTLAGWQAYFSLKLGLDPLNSSQGPGLAPGLAPITLQGFGPAQSRELADLRRCRQRIYWRGQARWGLGGGGVGSQIFMD